jgi:5-methylcytosine-specific restriction endonuclease McrA
LFAVPFLRFMADLRRELAMMREGQQQGRVELLKRAEKAQPQRRKPQPSDRKPKQGPKLKPPDERDSIPARVRFRVLQRDNYRCQYCGRTQQDGYEMHVDHIVPVAEGGPTTEDNLVTSCRDCNLGKWTTQVV